MLLSLESEDKSTGAELVDAIIINMDPNCLQNMAKSTSLKDRDCRAGTTKDEEIRCIIHNQPIIGLKRLTSAEIEHASKPPMQKLIRAKKAVGIYPNASTASKFKFKLSQYGIKCRYKRNYMYKC